MSARTVFAIDLTFHIVLTIMLLANVSVLGLASLYAATIEQLYFSVVGE